MTGLIKSYSSGRGFGFITPLVGKPNSTEAVFFHVSGVAGRVDGGPEPALPRGAEVTFDLVRGENGPQATNVTLVKLGGNSLQRSQK